MQSKFYQIRHVAGIRCNQLRRLYEATRQAVAAVEANDLRCPYEFSYEETAQTMGRRAVRQRVELTLWDSNSLREHAVARGYHEAPATTLQRRWQEASFSPKNRAYFVEYNATTSLTQGCPGEPFWFLDLFRHRVFRHLDVRSDSDLAERRGAFYAEWGYESKSAWADGGLLGCARKYSTLLNNKSNQLIVSFSYFQNVIEEVGELQMSEDYWRYLQLRIHQMERQWLEQTQDTEGARFNKRRIAPMSGRI